MKFAYLILAITLAGIATAGDYEDGYRDGYSSGWADCLAWMKNQTNISANLPELPEEEPAAIKRATKARLALPSEL